MWKGFRANQQLYGRKKIRFSGTWLFDSSTEDGKCDLIVSGQRDYNLSIDGFADSEMESFILELSLEKEISRFNQYGMAGGKWHKNIPASQEALSEKTERSKGHLHKVTRWLAEYCKRKISCVIIGDINIRAKRYRAQDKPEVSRTAV